LHYILPCAWQTHVQGWMAITRRTSPRFGLGCGSFLQDVPVLIDFLVLTANLATIRKTSRFLCTLEIPLIIPFRAVEDESLNNVRPARSCQCGNSMRLMLWTIIRGCPWATCPKNAARGSKCYSWTKCALRMGPIELLTYGKSLLGSQAVLNWRFRPILTGGLRGTWRNRIMVLIGEILFRFQLTCDTRLVILEWIYCSLTLVRFNIARSFTVLFLRVPRLCFWRESAGIVFIFCFDWDNFVLATIAGKDKFSHEFVLNRG